MVASSLQLRWPHIAPPWIAFPDVDPGAAEGLAEYSNYYDDWFHFFRSLNQQQRQDYKISYPAPNKWWDIYRFVFGRS